MGRMRALRWHGREDVRVDVIDVPTPGPGEALVQIDLCGICGTDLEEYRAGPISIPVERAHPLTGRRAPVVLGHEAVGTVAAVGSGVALDLGVRVVPDVVLGCGECWWCQRHQMGLCAALAVLGQHGDGGCAEYMLTPAAQAVVVPPDLEPEVAVFAETTAVAVRAMRKVSDITGGSVAILGAGAVGLLTAQVARAAGAASIVVIDPILARLQIAHRLGVDVVSAPEDAADAVKGVTDGRGADVVVECSGGQDTLEFALRLSRRGGTVVLVGVDPAASRIATLDVVIGERLIIGSAAHVWDEDVAAAVHLLSARIVDTASIPTHVTTLDAAVEEGFGDDRSDAIKVVVDPRSS